MIVQESDILLGALDRRLQVDRVQAVDGLAPIGRASPSPRPSAQPQATGIDAQAASPATVAARLPLGQLVTARVVEVPRPDHVIAEVEALRIELAWPNGTGAVPQPGRDVLLRVLAHAPMLLLQRVDDEVTSATATHDEDAPRWSSDALRLQAGLASTGPGDRAPGATRFDVPILEIEIVPHDPSSGEEAHEPTSLHFDPQRIDGRPPLIAHDAADPRARIALDDVIVARGTALVDGIAAPLIARDAGDASPVPTPFVPLVLQGPAWPGQPMELVVRRDRDDEQFDNPVLDSWCGELTIDLPQLGRVAGHLSFSMQGLRIRLEAEDATSVSAMSASAAELANAFAGVNVRVSALSVGCATPDTRPWDGPRDGG